MGDFIKPEPIRLPLSNGRFIVIKKRLTHGEREDMFARIAPFADADGIFKSSRREVRTAKVLAYLLGWSLTDGDCPGEGLPVPLSPEMPDQDRLDTIRSLDPDTFSEIHRAIDAHETAMNQEKKSPNGALGSKAISPSPSAAAGASSGSAN